MDVLANYSIFQELQLVHDTGYFSAMPSLEENWQQVRTSRRFFLYFPSSLLLFSISNLYRDAESQARARAHTGAPALMCVSHVN